MQALCALDRIVFPASASKARLGLLALWVFLSLSSRGAFASEGENFFEANVRPVLIEHCVRCHGSQKQEGGLRIDSRDALVRGGDSGPAILPGHSKRGLFIEAVRGDADRKMPPDDSLSPTQIKALERWLEGGAPFPEMGTAAISQHPQPALSHWAFQQVTAPAVPAIANMSWVRNPIDAFVSAKVQQAGLSTSDEADRLTIIRRATYTLTGLPPTNDATTRFLEDNDPRAYETLIERLLESPAYAEHWARHWLDVARYSDTKGYVYAREERFWTHAWTYRDWVVNAIGEDMPYDRFLLLQLAADQVEDSSPSDLAAMGFLTLGRRFLGVRRDVIDDRIDVVCRGTMGLTASCARCHDHKYDPIPTTDYYSLYGIFDSCMEQQTILAETPGDETYRGELAKREKALQDKLTQYSKEASQRARERIADYLFAQSELHKFPADGFDQVFQKSDLLPAFVRQWQQYLRETKRRGDPVFTLWHAYADLKPEQFTEEAANVLQHLRDAGRPINQRVATSFESPPGSFRDVCDRYAALFLQVEKETPSAERAQESPDTQALRNVLESPPCQVPQGPISQSETFFDSGSLTELWKLQGELDRWLIQAPRPVPVARYLIDKEIPVEPRVFQRGDPLKLGKDVPRRFLSCFSEKNQEPFRDGSGRLELARAIVDPSNPLTARVIVNRVWAYHFGVGLVTTPSDFGLRALPPSHPGLLDWLAADFVRHGWSLKHLHRLLLLSSTYRQASTGPADAAVLRQALQTDPENRLLWRMNPRRLSFEELRDSLLLASDSLDSTVGGRPVDLFESPFSVRRTLYGLVDRQYFPTALRVFDFANPDMHIPKRNETTVAQQALFFMNHPMVLERARSIAQLTRGDSPAHTVHQLFARVLQRAPTDEELSDALDFLSQTGESTESKPLETSKQWSYGYGTFDEEKAQTQNFEPLPHFNGDAWQGGEKWPDKQLGWVQLTAQGGHPGNTRKHAAIRRWTAPASMTISMDSRLVHEPTAGDGIRAFVISSRQGVLHSMSLHQTTADWASESLTIGQGETIDFLVDIDQVLNSDQFLWEVTLREPIGDDSSQRVWNSMMDFPKNRIARLDAIEQLAHIMVCANEFLFVD